MIAFCYLEELTDAALQAAQQPFCGYQGIPVVIMPAGLYKIGTVKESRFRTHLPCAMAILGENAGISPNCDDLRTANPARQEETVVQGSFYFGCIALRNGVDGTLILDGLMIRSAKIFDERTQGEALGLTLKNIVFDESLSYDLVRTLPTEPGCTRTILMQDFRADGIGSHFGEGRLLGFDAGNATVQRLYFANTDKFPGLTNYSRTVQNRLEGREGSMDYTMIFPAKTGLAQVMGAFPEFKYTGTWDGHYIYPRFTRERFRELGEYIYSIGGLMSHAHPMQLPGSGEPEDYFFSEQMAFETVHADVNAYATRQNHNLWLKLLAAGDGLFPEGLHRQGACLRCGI